MRWVSLKQIAQKNKIELQFDIFGTQSLRLCEKLNIKTVKIHPTDINNGKLLTSLKNSKIRNIILGVGGASYNEIILALEILKSKKIILMFGFQGYPTPINTNQLCRLNLIKPKLLKRYKNVADAKGYTIKDSIVNATSADQLSSEDQYALFFANLIESKAKLSDFTDGNLSPVDIWLQGHKNVEAEGDRASFLESKKAAEKLNFLKKVK